MSLRDQISNDIKTAMKAKEMDRLNALRMVQAAFKNREIELRPGVMPEEECLVVLRRLVKQRKESIDMYATAKRQDLVDAETREMELLQTYLPQQMSREQVETIIGEAIVTTGAKTVKDMGTVMKEVLARTNGQADNKMVSEIIKAKLA